MLKLSVIAALCAGAIILPSRPVVAQTMEFACPANQTKFVVEGGRYSVSQGQSGMYCIYASGAEATRVESYAMLYPFNEARKKDPNWAKYINPVRVEAIWPLSVGKRHSGTASVGGNSFTLDYVVAAFEKIDTPVGPDDVFRIEMTESGSSGYLAKAKWWVSPKHKTVMKYEFSDNRGGKFASTVQQITTQ
jgi:hypothetical protein